MPALRRYLSTLVLVACSLLIGLLLAELVVRLVRPQPWVDITAGLYEADPPRRYRLSPGYQGTISNGVDFTVEVAINRGGLRGPEIAPASAETYRILVVGDSFPFGWGVAAEETLAARLDTSLGQGEAVQVLNGGVPGYGLPDVAAWLEAYGLPLEPQLVLVAIFLGNDLLDATAAHRQVEIVNGLISGTGGGAQGPRRWLAAHSHLVRFAKNVMPLRLRQWLGLPEPWAITYRRDTIQSYAAALSPLIQEGRAASLAALDTIAAAVAAQGARLGVLLLPDRIQVDRQQWVAACAELGRMPEELEPDLPTNFFATALIARDIPYLDLVESFRRAEGEEALYFVHDPHWTAAGHRLAAAELHEFLRQEDLLTPVPPPVPPAVAEPVADTPPSSS